METLSANRIGHSSAIGIAVFAMHQLIGTIGILALTPLVTGLIFDVLRLFGLTYTSTYMHSLLTETPYFPLQIALALLLGWILSRWLHHRSMLWVWPLPLAVLLLAFSALPTVTSLAFQSRLSHFFGWGCRPQNRCFDQLAITLPFYIAASYSAGALLARKMLGKPLFMGDEHVGV
ncbi:MAG TPA: hypothetical protein VGR72_02525 [Candidatus Acidoferrales bacterium]|nr:hypothetical protein [Candidatus Acidoferrales bacterium]